MPRKQDFHYSFPNRKSQVHMTCLKRIAELRPKCGGTSPCTRSWHRKKFRRKADNNKKVGLLFTVQKTFCLKCNVRLKGECLTVKTKWPHVLKALLKLVPFQAVLVSKTILLHTKMQQLFKETLNIETYCVKVGGLKAWKVDNVCVLVLETKMKKP